MSCYFRKCCLINTFLFLFCILDVTLPLYILLIFPWSYFMPLKSDAGRLTGLYTCTHPPLFLYCSAPSIPLSLLFFTPCLLDTLASFGPWWGVTALPLSGRDSLLTLSVCVCVWTLLCVQHDCQNTAWCRIRVWACSVCVWPSLACRSDRHQDCAVTAGEEMIYLSGGWGTGKQIQLTDKSAVLLLG